jgi:hypothetical protein
VPVKESPNCVPSATLGRHHTSAVLPPERSLNPAANDRQRWSDDGGKMLGKLLALTTVLGLLVASSAAFVANHPSALTACAVGVLAKPLPAAGCN